MAKSPYNLIIHPLIKLQVANQQQKKQKTITVVLKYSPTGLKNFNHFIEDFLRNKMKIIRLIFHF